MADRHRPSYLSETSKKLRSYTVQLPPDIITAWKAATARAGIDQRHATEQLFSAFGREHGIRVSPRPRRRSNNRKPPPQSIDC